MQTFTRLLCSLVLLLLCQSIFAQTPLMPYAFNDKWGAVDANGLEAIPPSFDSLSFFFYAGDNKAAFIWEDNKMGLVNANGEVWIAPKMDSIQLSRHNNDATYISQKNKRWGLIGIENNKSKWLLKPKYDSIGLFVGEENQLAIIKNHKGIGVVNDEGHIIIKCAYTESELDIINPYTDYPTIQITQNNQVSLFNYQGQATTAEEMIELEEDYPEFVDMEVEEAEPKDKRVKEQELANGAHQFTLELDYGYGFKVAKQLEVSAEYSVVSYDLNEKDFLHFIVEKDGLQGVLNYEGALLVDVVYDHIDWSKSMYKFRASKNGLQGLISLNGKTFIPVAFSSITKSKGHYGNFYYLVHPDGYKAYANYKGMVFLPKTVKI